ncbi:hypothetical protein SAMN04489710_10917 [Paracidovorax konjaci]|uniref:Uncharacterized protein n=1 Tax=Paracidovorax konjaci TaxID=32040 RepID=A0A1I1WB56_9BURK|nr:hypothetical protein SAMN04489710_10917 [Paracidovorax konjaci]
MLFLAFPPGAGSRPGGRGPFLCFAKEKAPKERRPCWLRPPSPEGRRGQPAVLGHGARLRNSLRAGALRSDIAASQITKRACPSARPRAPRPVLLGASRRVGSTRAIAALGLGCASAAHRAPFVEEDVSPCQDRAQRQSSQAEQRDGPKGFGRPSEAKARNAPSGCAWGAQGAGWRVCRRTHPLQHLARRGCLSGARQRAASSAAHPATEHPRLPRSAAKGTQPAGSPFFWVLFFGEAKKSTSAAGPRPGPGKQPQNKTPPQRRAAEPQSRKAQRNHQSTTKK